MFHSYFCKISLGPATKFVCLRFWARKQSIQCCKSAGLWKQANTGVHPLCLKEARGICLSNQETKWFTATSKVNREWLVHVSWLLSSWCNGRLIRVWVHCLSLSAALPDWHPWNCCNRSIWKSILGPEASRPPGKSDNGSTSSALKMFSRENCWRLHKLTFESYTWSTWPDQAINS